MSRNRSRESLSSQGTIESRLAFKIRTISRRGTSHVSHRAPVLSERFLILWQPPILDRLPIAYLERYNAPRSTLHLASQGSKQERGPRSERRDIHELPHPTSYAIVAQGRPGIHPRCKILCLLRRHVIMILSTLWINGITRDDCQVQLGALSFSGRSFCSREASTFLQYPGNCTKRRVSGPRGCGEHGFRESTRQNPTTANAPWLAYTSDDGRSLEDL